MDSVLHVDVLQVSNQGLRLSSKPWYISRYSDELGHVRDVRRFNLCDERNTDDIADFRKRTPLFMP